jgi:hypothetical protein
LILALVKCFLGLRVISTKAVDKASNKKAGAAELSSKSSESDGKLYYISSLSLLCLLECLLSDKLGGEKSSD